MKKSVKWLQFSCLIIALVVTYMFVEDLFCIKSAHGIKQASEMYIQPEDTIDVVFLGSSHVHTNINTAQLWEDYGIASYDYSGADQPLWMTYHYLKEICKYQEPEIVVVDLFSAGAYDTEYYDDFVFMTDNLNGFKFSLNKLEMIVDSCNINNITDYFPSFVTWHMRYDELKEEDFDSLFVSEDERQTFKGYTPYFGVCPQTLPTEVSSERKLSKKESSYLQKIKTFCKDNNIELLLVTAPHVEEAEKAQEIYNYIEKLARKEDYIFVNGMKLFDEIGIDPSKDFNDSSHLNYWGSCKYTEYLGDILVSEFDIPDRRGDALYQSWDEHISEIEKTVEEKS